MSGIYMILSMSLNVQLGFTGLFSFGHAAFYGIGAYASALLTRDLGLPFVAAFILSGLFTAFIGTLIALPALRLKGIFLAIGTMCFNEIFCLLSTNLESLTGLSSDFRKFDLAIPMGVSYEVAHFVFDVRYNIGLISIFKDGDSCRNGTLQITAGYKFQF